MAHESKEVFTTSRSGTSPLKPMQADSSFGYVTVRGCTFWPEINKNNAFWLEESRGPVKGLKEFVGTDKGFKFGLANIYHSVGEGRTNQVIGSIRDEALVSGSGVDIMAQIDKRACAAFGIEPKDFETGEFSSASIEIWCNRDESLFVALTAPGSKNLDDQVIFTAEEAEAQGIRRTKWNEPEPYLYQGKYIVAEACSPIRCRGIAFVPNPADKTANVFEVAASLEMASDLSSEIAKVKEQFGISQEEKSGFSTVDTPIVTPTTAGLSESDELPDEAYADVDREEDGSSKRAYPLYASAKSFAEKKPHEGLVKAALQAHADGKMKNPSLALQRLQVAHSQLHGDKSMEAQELASEVAKLQAQVATLTETAEEASNAVTAKDKEIADLAATNKALSEEKAALEEKIAQKASEEKASERLAKLTAIEGFTVKDEEKASLTEALKAEDETAFENRVLKAKIASMEAASAKVTAEKKAAEEKAAAEAKAGEEAAATLNVDFIPNGLGQAAGKVTFADLI